MCPGHANTSLSPDPRPTEVERFDVLVVGGGPAGSTLAYYLSGSGLKIAIMDKQDFPRQKICAGWVTPAVMQELNIDLVDYGSFAECLAGPEVTPPLVGGGVTTEQCLFAFYFDGDGDVDLEDFWILHGLLGA